MYKAGLDITDMDKVDLAKIMRTCIDAMKYGIDYHWDSEEKDYKEYQEPDKLVVTEEDGVPMLTVWYKWTEFYFDCEGNPLGWQVHKQVEEAEK